MLTHKFMDDTSISEVVNKRQNQIESDVDESLSSSSDIRMNDNTWKTKMILGKLTELRVSE